MTTSAPVASVIITPLTRETIVRVVITPLQPS